MRTISNWVLAALIVSSLLVATNAQTPEDKAANGYIPKPLDKAGFRASQVS